MSNFARSNEMTQWLEIQKEHANRQVQEIMTMNVKENAGVMLEQVRAHLANVEGQLSATKMELAATKSLLSQEQARRVDGVRALYVNIDGTTRNAPVVAGPEGPLRDVRFVDMSPVPSWCPRRHESTHTRVYRLRFTTRTLAVYEEV